MNNWEELEKKLKDSIPKIIEELKKSGAQLAEEVKKIDSMQSITIMLEEIQQTHTDILNGKLPLGQGNKIIERYTDALSLEGYHIRNTMQRIAYYRAIKTAENVFKASLEICAKLAPVIIGVI